jgi:quinol monooxygenase YgiN
MNARREGADRASRGIPRIAGAIPSEAYAIVAEFRAKPGREDELRRATQPLVERAWSEPNTLVFFLHEDRETPGHFIFYEVYASQADFETHRASPHVQSWFARLPELTEAGIRASHLEILGPS